MRSLIAALTCLLAVLTAQRAEASPRDGVRCGADADLAAVIELADVPDSDAEETRWVCDAAWLVAVYGQALVPMCLDEGASAVAPPPLREAAGGAIEAGPSCGERASMLAALLSRDEQQERQPTAELPKAPGAALLPAVPLLPAAHEAALVPARPVLRDDGAATGFAGRVYRPPRG